MNIALKTLWTASAALFLSSIQVVTALSPYVTQPELCEFDFCTYDTFSNPTGLFIDAEYLYLKATEDGLAIGSIFSGSALEGFEVIHRKVENPKTRWNSGVRGGIGYVLPHDWDVVGYYTHFNNKSTRNLNITTSEETFSPAWGMGHTSSTPDTDTDRVASHWNLDLNLLDVEFGGTFTASNFNVRPFIGVRAGWIHQKMQIREFVFVGIEELLQITNLRSKYSGAGIRGGLDADWYIFAGFSLYGTVAASVLYGEFHNCFGNVYYSSDTTGMVDTENDSFCACRAITDARIGIQWEDPCLLGCLGLAIRLGWEHHLFFDQNKFESSFMNDSEVSVGRGDLCLQGANLSVEVTF